MSLKSKIAAAFLSVLLVTGIANADKVTTYTAQATGLGTEVFYCVVGSTDCTITLQVISGFISGNTVRTLNWYATTDLCATTTGPIDVISTTATKLIIDRAATCSENKTDPRTLAIEIVPGGKITMTTGKLLQITGPFDAPMAQQVFFNATAGQGTVNLKGAGLLSRIHPAWWGDLGNASHDDTAAIQAALVAASDLYRSGTGGGYSAHVELSSGTHIISAPLQHYCYVDFVGQSMGGSQLQGTGDFNFFNIDGNGCTGAGGFTLYVGVHNIRMVKTGGTTASNYMNLDHCFQINIGQVTSSNSTGHGLTATDCNTVVLDHVALGGKTGSVGTALRVIRSNVTGINVSMELFDKGCYSQYGSSVMGQMTLINPYFEGNFTTLCEFDASFGNTIISPTVKNATTFATVVGFSAINGAHHNVVCGGNIGTIHDDGFTPTFKSDATSYQNVVCPGTSYQVNRGTVPDAGWSVGGSLPSLSANYSVSMTPDTTIANIYNYTLTGATAGVVNAPLYSSANGTELLFTFIGATATPPAITWNAIFHMKTAPTMPANGFNGTIAFKFDGTLYREMWRNGFDVPN